MTASPTTATTGALDAPAPRLPPVAQAATASLGLAIVGGILMASYVPRRPPLTVPIVLIALGGALLVLAIAMLARSHDLNRGAFFLVGKWALLAYLVQGGMIEYAFVHNHTRGAPLAVVTLGLILFVLDVPLIIGFTVARYQTPSRSTS
jgi:hypothetical protein